MIQHTINTNTETPTQSQYITKPEIKCDELELYLGRIFEKELNTPNSVLLGYNQIVIFNKRCAIDFMFTGTSIRRYFRLK